MKRISFVLPVYNEEQVIDDFYLAITKGVEKIIEDYHIEFIFINDGSSDKTEEKLTLLHKKDKRVSIINFSRNFGHQMAITAGIDFASGDAVIVMDSDLQDPPAVALELISKWEEGFDVVYGVRKTRKDSAFKQLTARLFYKLINMLSEVAIPQNAGDFRLMDKKVVAELRKFRERGRFMRGLVSLVGFRQTGVLFDRPNRYAGETKYPFKKMLKLSIDAVTSFSTVPLTLISRLGFIVSGLSFLGILYALLMKFFFPQVTVSGWTLLIIAIFFIGGVQMIMLGIVGTYIGKIYSEVKGRPLYIVSSIYSDSYDQDKTANKKAIRK